MLDLEETYAAAEVTVIPERVVVSPATGKFKPLPPEIFTTEGEWVQPGQILAQIHSGKSVVPVVCAFSGWMMGMLAVAGQPVDTGDQLFWVRT